jgi:rsbT co-antagonist protein RsbR
VNHSDLPATTLLYATLAINGALTPSGDTWEHILGWSTADLASTTFLEWVHPDDRDAVITAVHAVYTGVTVLSFVCRFSGKYGDYAWLHWTVTPHTRHIELELVGRLIPPP